MRIYDNGVYRDMTQEEIDTMNNTLSSDIAPIPSIDEKVEQLESILKILGGDYNG